VTQEIELQRAKRLKQIVNWLEEGYSYTEIGTNLGITRQAVSDFAKKHNLPKPQFLTASDAARLWGCSVSTVLCLAKQGKIPVERRNGRWHILSKENPRLCLICGRPVQGGRYKYCCTKHFEQACYESHKRSNWRRFKMSPKGGQPRVQDKKSTDPVN
jgi:hypothetical protein